MANIFLSYVHEDEPRARAIAALLEREGHTLWWDRHIRGGTQYASEIEAALAAAERVVVLWSRQSILSAWVRDEAAVGRDTDRLVPVVIDGTEPPLGFRQFQTIDLSAWRGRGKSPQVQRLIEAVAVGAPEAPSVPPVRALKSARPRVPRRAMLIGGSAIMVAAAAAAILVFWPSNQSGEVPRVAIVAADNSPQSQQIARDLSIRVVGLPGAASQFQLVDNAAAKDLLLRAGGSASSGRSDLELRRGNGDILWTLSVQANPAELGQQLAVRTLQALGCASDALTYRRERISEDTLKLYLSGCTNFDSAYGTNQDNSGEIKLFGDVIAKAPHFEPAWAKMLTSEYDQVGSADDPKAFQKKIAGDVGKAEGLGLDFGELYAAKAMTLLPTDFEGIFRTFEDGIKHHPDNAMLYRSRGERSMYVGRMNDAIVDLQHAVQLAPLSPVNQETLASVYAYRGDTDAGYAQLRKAEALWPSAPAVIFARYRLDLRYGDPKEALKLLQDQTDQGALQAEQAAFIRARIDPSPQNIERSIGEDRKIYRQYPDFIGQIVQTLAQFGRKDEVLDILLHYNGGEGAGYAAEVLFRPALHDVWRDPRSIAAAARLRLLRYWEKSGRWPDFCSDPKLPYDCKTEAAKIPAALKD